MNQAKINTFSTREIRITLISKNTNVLFLVQFREMQDSTPTRSDEDNAEGLQSAVADSRQERAA